MASSVVGGKQMNGMADGRIVTRNAIDEILKFYHLKPTDIPPSVKELDDQLDYALRPHGIMYRTVELEEGWLNDAFGPMIVFRQEDALPVAVVPGPIHGYSYVDAGGNRHPVRKDMASSFDRDAIVFYRPFPLKKIGIPDLFNYMKDCVSGGDVGLFVAISLMITLVGLMVPNITKLLTGFVVSTGKTNVLWGTALLLFCTALTRFQRRMEKRLSRYGGVKA